MNFCIQIGYIRDNYMILTVHITGENNGDRKCKNSSTFKCSEFVTIKREICRWSTLNQIIPDIKKSTFKSDKMDIIYFKDKEIAEFYNCEEELKKNKYTGIYNIYNEDGDLYKKIKFNKGNIKK